MKEVVKKGSWVEINNIVLEPKDRAQNIPDDTKGVPLEMRVKGFLVSDAKLGDEAEVLTPAKRVVRGKLSEVNPTYDHGFGPPIPELVNIGMEVRDILEESRRKWGDDK